MQRILVADDHPLFLDGIITLLTAMLPSTTVYAASTIKQVINQLERVPMDLLLLDRVMPGMDGMKRLPELRHQFPNVAVCIVSASESSQYIKDALDHGAIGYIPKTYPPDKTISAVKKILTGDIFIPEEALGVQLSSSNAEIGFLLSSRQLDVISGMARGQSNKAIANELRITEGTVKQHASNIFKLLNVTNRTSAIQRSRDLGLLS